MLPRSYKDVRVSDGMKPFRNPARKPNQIKESKSKHFLELNFSQF